MHKQDILAWDENALRDGQLQIDQTKTAIDYNAILTDAANGKIPNFFAEFKRAIDYQARLLFSMLEDAKEVAPCFAKGGPLWQLTNTHKTMQTNLTLFLRKELEKMPGGYPALKKFDQHLDELRADNNAGISPTTSPWDFVEDMRLWEYSDDPESPYQQWQNIRESYWKKEEEERVIVEKTIAEHTEALAPMGIDNIFALNEVLDKRHLSRFISIDPFISPGTHPSTTTLLHYDPAKHNAASIRAKLQDFTDRFHNHLCGRGYSMAYEGKLPNISRGESGQGEMENVHKNIKKELDEIVEEVAKKYEEKPVIDDPSPDYWVRRVHEGMSHADAERYTSGCRD